MILIALTAIVVLALIPANPVSRRGMAQPSPVAWDTVSNKASERMTLTWQGIIVHPTGRADSWIERNLESQFNLQIEPIFLDYAGYINRRPLMLCGGDAPDIMWDGDPLGLRANLRNGFIMEVPYDLILKYAPTYVKFLNRYGKEAWLYAHHNGKNFGLPTFFGNALPPRISTWRMDWLRRVGIARVPETVEEMHEALRRFRYNDPDGNGKQDTYGWCPEIGHWSLMFAEIFAAYDILAFDLMRKDGRVVWGGILPGAREALRVMRQWYEEGIIDPDFVLNTQGGTSDRKFVNGRVGYLHPVDSPEEYEADRPNSLLGKLRTFHPEAEMAPGPPLRNSRGERRGRTWGGAGHIIQFSRQLEQRPDRVVRVLAMMESLASSQERYMQSRYGQRGKHWAYTPEQGLMRLEPYKGQERLAAQEMLPATVFYFPSVIAEYEDAYKKPAYRRWIETNAKVEWGMMNVLGKSDVIPSAGRYLGDLVRFQTTVFTKMVVGDRSLDTFDDFVAEWRRRGGDVLLQEANAMSDTMQSIWKRVGVEE